MIQGKKKNFSFKIVGVENCKKFGEFLNKLEREGKLKEMSYREMAAEFLAREDYDDE